MITNIIGKYEDTLIKANYELAICNANILSSYLKNLYHSLNINIDDHNGDLKEKYFSFETEQKIISDNPPTEIYEYQNFFLLQKKSGEYILLDGFRRLLWYNAPSTPVFVRIYQEEDLTNENILMLLVYLNHFKFFGGGQYLERGFSLLMKTVFDLNIFNYKTTFNGYLAHKEIKHTYSLEKSNGLKHNSTIKERILNPFFVSDMKFIQKIHEAGLMVNSFFGALVYKKRTENNIDFNADLFINFLNNNDVFKSLMVKYNKVGTTQSAESMKVINQIMEFYEQAFITILGGNVEKSYAEKVQECKDIVAKLKKDKNLIKLTGNTKYWKIEAELEKRIIKNKEKVRFVCVILPTQTKSFSDTFSKEEIKYLDYGILDVNIVYLNTTQHLMVITNHYGFVINDKTYTIAHNYGGYYGRGKSFTHITTQNHGGRSQDIELFAELPKSILEK